MREAEVEDIGDLPKVLSLVNGCAELESAIPDLQLLIQCSFHGIEKESLTLKTKTTECIYTCVYGYVYNTYTHIHTHIFFHILVF